MGIYIKNWSLADWKELLKWAKIGANNAMIGEFTEVEEVPPHGRLGDLDAVVAEIQSAIGNMAYSYSYLLREEQSQREHGMVFARDIVCDAPTIIPAEEGE